MFKLENINKKMIVAFVVLATVFCVSIPFIAYADEVEYPGYAEGSFTGTSAETEVCLKLDEDSQLKFTAPTVINFALKSDGEFAVPTGAYIKNNSAFKIKVSAFDVTNASGTTGVESINSQTEDNTYQISVKGGNSSNVPFAVDSPNGWTGWTIDVAGGDDTCTLTFEGKMINAIGSKWVSGSKLQDVVWTVTANTN